MSGTEEITIICSVCEKVMGTKIGRADPNVAPVSHSYCEKCLEKAMGGTGRAA